MYLTEEKNEFYLESFKHIKKCDDKFWNLDNELEQLLNEINKSKLIKTLYSKKGSSQNSFGKISYLNFCYAKKLESKIENELIPKLSIEFSGYKRIKFSFSKNEPKIGKNNPNEKHECLKYISNPHYWNVWNFRLKLDGGNSIIHNKFWESLKDKLIQLK